MTQNRPQARTPPRVPSVKVDTVLGVARTPEPSGEAVRRQMSRQRTTGTAPELALRSRLHHLGLRYRVNRRPVSEFRRTADVVFGPAKVCVMIDGCYWHACPLHATQPKANREWWAEKLRRNVERDRETDRVLQDAGWVVVRVWEHENPDEAAERIRAVVTARRPDPVTRS